MRRMIQIEMAVSRNSKAPDFTGLSVVFSSVTDGIGAIQTKEFHKWVADNVKKKQKGDPNGGKGKGRGGKDASAGDP